MRIKNAVESLCKRYMTRDPYELAACKNIKVVELPLGGIKGYYSTCYRQKIIHINSEISENDQLRTCAHELGHGILHSNSNTPFLRANTLFPIGKYEKEAEHFAIDLLYSDEDMQQYLQYPTSDVAVCLKFPVQLIEYRLSVMQEQFKILE